MSDSPPPFGARRPWRATLRLVALSALLLPPLVDASPRLDCTLSHGGKARSLSFTPASEPYTVQPVDIDERFRFKAVVIGDQNQVASISLYTYDLSTDYAVLLHQARYRSPMPVRVAESTVANASLTGTQSVYSLRRGRELEYRCTLIELEP